MNFRAVNLPKPEFPEELPVVARRDEIGAAINENQVVIVCGETGSGKTTQLPKICLGLGRGIDGIVGHTQPRRIAARSLAARVASELKTSVGHAVGYKVRFNDRTSPDTYIKIMTDGILLAETRSDPDLLAYDTIIIDEAHERGLNVDFLLGYLKRLLPRRPDLKLVITSATIDTQHFSAHFGNAPIIEVSGRTWPVEIRYRPTAVDDKEKREQDEQQALLDAVDELAREGDGDILVFLPGEREIRETAESLRKHHPPHTEILPLFGRLSAAQQHRVFEAHTGRRIVLATNVAETSLTVPGIRYVIDTGLARISRYSYRTKVQRLPVEPVSQASANQRAGRCGRIAAGICIRLYSEEDYLQRPEFTEPEILRTSLAAVILQMLVLKLGDIEQFPFLQPPDGRYIRDGLRLLHELGAIDHRQHLTDTGKKLASFPIDVRLGRMVLAAANEGCLAEVLVIASALAVQDPRERPFDHAQAADEKQSAFRDEKSDFMAYLNLWKFYHEQARHLSRSKLRKLCREYFLSPVRMREWHDIHQQLLGLVKDIGLRVNQIEADYAAVHRALLAGLLGNVACKTDAHEFTGPRNVKLNIFPGSGLFKKPPKWILAAELVETQRRYARTVARIEPQWVEKLAGHLVKRSYSDPHWEKNAGKVAAYEKITLYGLVIVAKRKINYGPVNPVSSREIFIRSALVQGELNTRAKFFAHNQTLLRDVQQLEAKARRRDILVDEEILFRYFDGRLPDGIYNAPAFEAWYRDASAGDGELLFLGREDLLQDAADDLQVTGFPNTFEVSGMKLPLEYYFEPGAEDDGVTVVIPVAALNQLAPDAFDWLVPGLLRERVAALIKTLPKNLRRNFVPAPDFAAAFLHATDNHCGNLLSALTLELKRITGIEVPIDEWRPDVIPDHLRMRFRVIDANGKTLITGRDLESIKRSSGARAKRDFQALPTHDMDQEDVIAWDFGDLPDYVEIRQQGIVARGYPALVAEENGSVALRVLDNLQSAATMHRSGTLRLFRYVAQKSIRYLEKNLPDLKAMCLAYSLLGSCKELQEDIVAAVIKQALLGEGDAIRSQTGFEKRAREAESNLMAVAVQLCGWLNATLDEYHLVARKLKGSIPQQWLALFTDVQQHLAQLIYAGFVTRTPFEQVRHLPRYLQAVRLRLERAEHDPARDRKLAATLALYTSRSSSDDYRWLLEEYRVSLFAQELGTARPVSEKRLAAALDGVPL